MRIITAVNTKCGNCYFFHNGCVTDDPEDAESWCPDWDTMEIDSSKEGMEIMGTIGGDVWDQSRELSSGTLASLSGFTLYDQVYAIRLAFVEFCQENNTKFETWAAAWRAFWPVFQTTKEYKNL